MSDPHPSGPRRRTLLLIGAGVLLASAGALALVSGLAIADEPGKSLDVPALVVEVDPAPDPTVPATPVPTSTVPSPAAETPGSPELVPAPAPVVVDDDDADEVGDDADDDDDGSTDD